jgi:hypothetical protein
MVIGYEDARIAEAVGDQMSGIASEITPLAPCRAGLLRR